MSAVLTAQFLSAMADNALLFGALALLKVRSYPDWSAPLLAAKYGILSELTGPEQLVKANGLMEGSTIAAILAGAIAGGTLADWSVPGILVAVTLCYGAAAAANLLIPRLPVAHPMTTISFAALWRDFAHAVSGILRNRDARFSIAGTSLFWGAGATLRFLLIAWVPVALGITSHAMPAYLNATVAVGIVIGAGLAARLVSLERADRTLPAGVLLGIAVWVLAGTSSTPVAFVIMTLIGACGGFFIVPLNALLQERGHASVGAGHAIAVQNLFENGAILLMIGLYSATVHLGVSVTVIAAGFGAALSASIGALWFVRVRNNARALRAVHNRGTTMPR
jgi:LPLT family lysophospholipid transporter-like MFS transporter